MPQTVPSWMIGLTAGNLKNDTHQQDGAHLRIMPSPIAGLPLTPYAISIAELQMSEKDMRAEGWDIRWQDANGVPLTPPFDLPGDAPVYGILSRRAVFVTLRVIEDDENDDGGFTPTPFPGFERPPIRTLPDHFDVRPDPLGTRIGGFDRFRPIGSGSGRFGAGRFGTRIPDTRTPDVRIPDLVFPDGRIPDISIPDGLFPSPAPSRLRMSVLGDGLDPDMELAVTRQAPWELGGQSITRVKLEGTGRVLSGAFVPEGLISGDLQTDQGVIKWRDPDYWSLPVEPQPHYGPTPDAVNEGRQRAEQFAGPVKPMQEAPGATPATAPPRPAGEGLFRAELGFEQIKDDLVNLLVAGGIAQPFRSRVVEFEDHGSDRDTNANAGQTFGLPSLAVTLSAGLDPDLGRLLGFFGQVPKTGGTTLIRVRCAMSFDINTLVTLAEEDPDFGYDGLAQDAARLTMNPNRDSFLGLVADDPQLFQSVKDLARRTPGPFIDAAAYIAIPVGTIATAPDIPTQLAAGPGHWNVQPDRADSSRSLHIKATLPDGTLAGIARTKIPQGQWSALGPELDNGPHRAMITGDPVDLQVPGAKERVQFFDGTAPEDARYRVAACNLLGQWSNWAEVDAAHLRKPGPPPPQITLDVVYDLNNPARLGELRISVAKPDANSIPPGGSPIETLKLWVQTRAGAVFSAQPDIDHSEAFESVVSLQIPSNSPEIATVRAQFIDRALTPSEVGTADRTYTDPTPPLPVNISPTLEFASRPDALGLSRFRLSWPAPTGAARYRIYYAEQGGLLGVLARVNGAGRALANAIEDIEDLAARAAEIERVLADLPKTAFEVIAETEELNHEITVGGAIDGLGLLRVIPVSSANVEADFVTSGFKPFAVPNADAPPVPHVRVIPVAGPNPALAIQIEVPPTHTQPEQIRLKRTRASSDPRAYSDVAILDGAPERGDDGSFVYTYLDTGPLVHEPGLALAPYTAYSYSAQARFDARSNGGPMGDWSAASPGAASIWVPDGPPPPVTDLSAELALGVVSLAFTWTGDRDTGTLGSYVFDIFGPNEDGRETLLATLDASEIGIGNAVATTLGAHPLGAWIRVSVTDPAGRRSAMAATQVEIAP